MRAASNRRELTSGSIWKSLLLLRCHYWRIICSAALQHSRFDFCWKLHRQVRICRSGCQQPADYLSGWCFRRDRRRFRNCDRADFRQQEQTAPRPRHSQHGGNDPCQRPADDAARLLTCPDLPAAGANADGAFGQCHRLSADLLSVFLVVVTYNFGSGILRALGDSKARYMRSLWRSAECRNGRLFIRVLRGGVNGAAWATLISQTAAAGMVLVCLVRLEPAYALRPVRSLLTVRSSSKLFRSVCRPVSSRLSSHSQCDGPISHQFFWRGFDCCIYGLF